MDKDIDLLQIKIDKAKAELSKDTLDAIAAVDWQAVILGMREKKGYTIEQLGDLEIETELLLCGLLDPINYGRELEKRMGISKAQANDLVEEMNRFVFSKIRQELSKNLERKKIFAKSAKAPVVNTPTSAEIPVVPQIAKSDHEILKTMGIEITNGEVAKGEEAKPEPPKARVVEEKKPEAIPPVIEKPVEREIKLPVLDKLELTGEVQPEPEKTPAVSEVKPILAQKLAGYVQNEVVKTDHSETPAAETPKAPAPIVKSYPKGADPYRLTPEK